MLVSEARQVAPSRLKKAEPGGPTVPAFQEGPCPDTSVRLMPLAAANKTCLPLGGKAPRWQRDRRSVQQVASEQVRGKERRKDCWTRRRATEAGASQSPAATPAPGLRTRPVPVLPGRRRPWPATRAALQQARREAVSERLCHSSCHRKPVHFPSAVARGGGSWRRGHDLPLRRPLGIPVIAHPRVPPRCLPQAGLP